MGTGEGLETLYILLVGIVGMFLMALAIIFFFITYQRRLLRQHKMQKELEFGYQKELLRASIRSQENERQRIAKDLHDDIGAMLSTSKLYVGLLLEEALDEKHLKISKKIDHLHRNMIKTVRAIAQDLRPIVLENMGLFVALESLANSINESGKIHIQVNYEGDVTFSKESQLELYRVVQELISNTLKHAEAKHVSITFYETPSAICMRYQDDGKGFDSKLVNMSARKTGLGLKNIESRMSFLNGEMEFKKVDIGTELVLTIPHTTLTTIS